ncbi:putative protein-serine/threonine phosphatase [Medicago truncatula]|uniref:Carboxy-terminal domain phosphatase-like protein, putative n=1 Tax=Medicago truncatula TaxID=3880 RepID=A0A072UPU8_MEDTR|nr:carboxy-terminal domain phosphatase-like protein, putative [Medicago truncatula]RHN62453.1 putative protein-serine/threonine phosphatase [Medicago truncatula]
MGLCRCSACSGKNYILVALHSWNDDRPCFWGFIVPMGLYNSSLVMLNLRCLGIVFDLDETLVVANTMRSFEDRIDAPHRLVEIDGQVYGKGTGLTWNVAKMQAAEKALGSQRTMHGQGIQRWQSSPRPFQGFSYKRLKQEHSRILQGFASSGRYRRNATAIP